MTPIRRVLALLPLLAFAAPEALAAQCGPAEERPAVERREGPPRGRAEMEPREGPPEHRSQDPVEPGERAWWNVWSKASVEDRLIWGMWTTHLNRENDGWQNDKTLGVVYEGFYAATFRTTHGPRAYTVGVERTWGAASAGPVAGMIGFRSGLVYGYDGRLGWVAEAVPILPFAQPVVYGRIGPLTADVTYTWVVISVTAGLRF